MAQQTGPDGIALSYDELEGCTEEYTIDGGVSAVRILQTTWENMREFPAAILGTSYRQGATAAADRLIRRYVPQRHPARANLYATSLRLLNGIGAAVDDTDYANTFGAIPVLYRNMANGVDVGDGKAKWEVTYTLPPFSVASDTVIDAKPGGNFREMGRFLERRKTYSAESLQVPASTYKWVTAPQDTYAEPGTKLFPTIQLEYVWYWVPEPLNEAAFQNALGKVNSTAFDAADTVSGLNLGIGTVLFVAPEMKRVSCPGLSVGAVTVWNITFQFLYKRDGWNKFLRRSTGVFDTLSRDGTTATTDGNLTYDSYELNNLFTAGLS